jgi:hypothetical protein
MCVLIIAPWRTHDTLSDYSVFIRTSPAAFSKHRTVRVRFWISLNSADIATTHSFSHPSHHPSFFCCLSFFNSAFFLLSMLTHHPYLGPCAGKQRRGSMSPTSLAFSHKVSRSGKQPHTSSLSAFVEEKSEGEERGRRANITRFSHGFG